MVDYADAIKQLGFLENGAEAPSFDNAANGLDADFDGTLDVRALSSGIKITVESVTARSDTSFKGVLPPSLMLRVPLGASKPVVRSPILKPSHPDPTDAAAFALAEPTEFEAVIRKGQSFQTIGVQASPEDLQDEALAEAVAMAQRSMTITPLVPWARAHALARELFSAQNAGPVGDLLAESCALELLARALDAILPSMSNEPALKKRERAGLLRVRDKIVENPGTDHRIVDLAREAGMSPTSLKSKFAELFGQPISAFVREVRLLRAYEGLEREHWSAAEAAYFVGYRHPSSFSYAFRRRFGVAPGAVGANRDAP